MSAPHLLSRESLSTAEAVGTLRRWIETVCGDAGASDDQRASVVLAVSEALTNVVMHAYTEGSGPGPMRIRAESVDHRLNVEVEDDGVGLRPRTDSPGAGMGLTVIAALAAELNLAHGPGGAGTLVRMSFAVG